MRAPSRARHRLPARRRMASLRWLRFCAREVRNSVAQVFRSRTRLLGALRRELACRALTAFALELDFVAGYCAGVLLLYRVAAVLHLHGERDGVAADFAVHDRDIALSARDASGQFVAICFEVEGLLTRSALPARH